MATILYQDKETTVILKNNIITKIKDDTKSYEINIQNLANKLGLAPEIYSYNKNYIKMEYIDGLSLDNYLKTSNDRNDLKSKLRTALTKLYDNGIDHRDLKGNNIYINSKNEIKIIDYEHAVLHNGPVPKNKRDYGILKNF